MLRLRDIQALGDDRYDVTFADEQGATERAVCRVFRHKGVFGIDMEPDLIMGAEAPRIDSREVARAVIDFHKRRSGIK